MRKISICETCRNRVWLYDDWKNKPNYYMCCYDGIELDEDDDVITYTDKTFRTLSIPLDCPYECKHLVLEQDDA